MMNGTACLVKLTRSVLLLRMVLLRLLRKMATLTDRRMRLRVWLKLAFDVLRVYMLNATF